MTKMRGTTKDLNALQSLSRHNHLLQRHNATTSASLVVASAVTIACFTALVDNNYNSADSVESTTYYETRAFFPSFGHQSCLCDSANHHSKQDLTLLKPTTLCKPKPLSRLTLMAYTSKLYPHSYLPTPRVLTPRDPIFSYPELQRGLIHRAKDEEKMKDILTSHELMEARKNQDHIKMQQILRHMNSVVHGEKISPQMREGKIFFIFIYPFWSKSSSLIILLNIFRMSDFVMQYGCTGYTEAIIHYLLHNFASRGIIEVGAGNGQWARALNDSYNKQSNFANDNPTTTSASWEFVLAYDTMEQLPLPPTVYHKNTLPANKYFYNKVKQLSHLEAVRESRGRVLLLVYPPPGPMAVEAVRAYLDASCGHYGGVQNDTVVYVGEGRGGANANDEFFDLFLSCEKEDDGDQRQECWVIEKVMDVIASPGGKGYEKLFVFRREVSPVG